MKDYYVILGVERTATIDEIKKVYRQLALKYHPDQNPDNPDAEERFKEITEAYQILSNPDKRARYDSGGMYDNNDSFFGFGIEDALRVFFKDFGDFGFGGGYHRNNYGGEDLKIKMRLTLLEADKGCEKKINFRKYIRCDECNGTGIIANTISAGCSTCGGTGQVRRVSRSILGQFVTQYTCPDCNGSGISRKNMCKKCNGNARIINDTELKIKIPKGVGDGEVLRLRGEGNVGINNTQNGDLIIFIELIDDPRFDRDRNNLIYKVMIPLTTAVLGGKINVPTVDDETELEMESGTQSGQVYRIKGKGIHSRHSKGDLIVQVFVKIPTKLTKTEKELFEKISSIEEKSKDKFGLKDLLSKIGFK